VTHSIYKNNCNTGVVGMDSILLNRLKKVLGRHYLENKYVIEALSEYLEFNKAIALVGDSILNFTVKDIAYRKNPDPEFIDNMRQKYADKSSNQTIYNNDKNCQQYLIENKLSYAPAGNVSEEKADRIVEGMIGAIYYTNGWEDAISFTKEILYMHEDFKNKFQSLG
jgi:dsRNA-specific ribonuclease